MRGCGVDVAWHDTLRDLPHRPLLIVGNEFFDALPVRQFVKVARAWRERAVGLDEDGRLAFVGGTGSLDPALLPASAQEAPDGAIFETAPARAAVMDTIAGRIAAHGGAGLFIDYGYLRPGLGDTFQAVRKHRAEDVLESPGEADVTAHVDFSALAAVARGAGLDARLATQGDFLIGLGLLERAGRLGAGASESKQDEIRAAVERLAATDQMGELFKVLAVLPRGIRVPPFD
jgi:SAM-dependent MidA family methyltransferase